MRLIVLGVFIFLSQVICAQQGHEGLAPLYESGREGGSQVEPSTLRAFDKFVYYFKFDTVHLPFVDDFSKNYFKNYAFDTANLSLDTVVWVKYLFDGVFKPSLLAMNDTSYTYPVNTNGGYDSIPNPPIQVITFQSGVLNTPIDTDTVWVRPDTIFVGATVVTGHNADITYINEGDSIVIVPDDGYSLWRNNNALHNYTYGDDPVTIGVATFDGLDSLGTPYDPTMNPNSYQIADVLESKPLYLMTRPNGGGSYNPLIDTAIYFSFFYQPQGLGDAPEANDSLVLEFYSPFTKQWYHQWSASGEAVHPFKSVMVPIKNPIYFQDGFKFRFKNYASVSGNFDHWHIDYVRIAENRNPNDTTIDDVGLLDVGKSLLQDYSQMPWSHYKTANSASLMKTDQELRFRNNHSVSKLVTSSLEAYEKNNLLFSGSVEVTPNIGPFAIGTETITFSDMYPLTNSDSVQSFTVKHFINSTPDNNRDNDTSYFHQQFGTQYAYDDGSAESAYFVTSAGAQIAVEYNLAVADTLRAVNFYFPKSYESIVDRAFRVMVYESIDPEVVLYEGYLEYPIYSNRRDFITGIKLEEPLPVSGTIYVGIKQLDKRVYIGLDKNNDNQTRNFFKTGGSWTNSSYPGSLFIRPEFGSFSNPWPVSVPNEMEENSVSIYPNPARDFIRIESPSEDGEIKVFNSVGQLVYQEALRTQQQINVAHWPKGMYVITVINGMNTPQTEKIIVQ